AGIEIYPNPELKPESGWSSELGIKQGVKVGNWMGYLDVAGFLMQYDDMMEFTFAKWEEGDLLDGVGFKSVNVGKTQISGVEVSLSGQGEISSDLTINLLAGYTYMEPISLTPNDVYITSYNGYDLTYINSSSDPSILKYRYTHIAKIDTELAYKKLSLGGSLRYNDFMKNIDAIFASELFAIVVPGIIEARENAINGDLIIDARLGYQFNDMVRFGFVVNNLLNREYTTRPATMMAPRTFVFQLALKI
ncbi:MAG: TonB-dependent receptor, partial [Cryomorphaceae bacterium]|nr:TonB-dependent receptor [Cryomorphaceae bacterium]